VSTFECGTITISDHGQKNAGYHAAKKANTFFILVENHTITSIVESGLYISFSG
jgi:hypothetical protein